MVSGTTKIFFMLAHPIEHVRAPEVFNPIFKQRRVDAIMIPIHFQPEDFEVCWQSMRKMRNLGGLVLSVPLKEAAYELSDVVDESAAEVRAANVVRREWDGRMVCANFDGPGFLAGPLGGGQDALGKHALLIGAGGAGSSIAFTLAKAGVASIMIADIVPGRAERLASSVRSRYPTLKVEAGDANPDGRDLIVNATPCGLHPDKDPLPLDITKLNRSMIVADIIMKPSTTPLLVAAQRAGCDIRFGAGMLEMQTELILRFLGYDNSGG